MVQLSRRNFHLVSVVGNGASYCLYSQILCIQLCDARTLQDFPGQDLILCFFLTEV